MIIEGGEKFIRVGRVADGWADRLLRSRQRKERQRCASLRWGKINDSPDQICRDISRTVANESVEEVKTEFRTSRRERESGGIASSASSRVLSRRLFCARKIDGWEEEEEEANGAQRSQLNYSRLSISLALSLGRPQSFLRSVDFLRWPAIEKDCVS